MQCNLIFATKWHFAQNWVWEMKHLMGMVKWTCNNNHQTGYFFLFYMYLFYYHIRLQESIVTVPYYFFPTIFAGTITCCSSQVAIELVAWQEWIWAWSSWQCWMNLFLGRLSVIKMLMCSRNSATQDKHITASPVQRWRRETATRFPMLQVMEQRKWAWLFTSWRVLLADHTRPYHLAAVHDVLLCLEKLVVNSFQAKKKTTLRSKMWETFAKHLSLIDQPKFKVSRKAFLAFLFNQHSVQNMRVTVNKEYIFLKLVFVDFKYLVYFNEKLPQKKIRLVIWEMRGFANGVYCPTRCSDKIQFSSLLNLHMSIYKTVSQFFI